MTDYEILSLILSGIVSISIFSTFLGSIVVIIMMFLNRPFGDTSLKNMFTAYWIAQDHMFNNNDKTEDKLEKFWQARMAFKLEFGSTKYIDKFTKKYDDYHCINKYIIEEGIIKRTNIIIRFFKFFRFYFYRRKNTTIGYYFYDLTNYAIK